MTASPMPQERAPDAPKTGRIRHARQSQTRRGGDAGVPMGLPAPHVCSLCSPVRMARKALLSPLLPNSTPAPPGLRAKGPPRCPYLQELLLSTLHSSGKHRVPARCFLSGLGGSMGAEPTVGSALHPPASGTEPVARAAVPGKAGGTVVSPLLSACPGRRPLREGQSPSEGWKCCMPP